MSEKAKAFQPVALVPQKLLESRSAQGAEQSSKSPGYSRPPQKVRISLKRELPTCDVELVFLSFLSSGLLLTYPLFMAAILFVYNILKGVRFCQLNLNLNSVTPISLSSQSIRTLLVNQTVSFVALRHEIRTLILKL